jgi:tRNA-splicing ligase RtcB
MPFGQQSFKKPEFIKVSDVVWDIPKTFKPGMRVPVRVIATKKLLDDMDLQVYDQASNVATLPGIQKYSFVMPDGHSGYGFSIGGVAAFDVNDNGVISPGGIGFDINCGMRLVLTNLTIDQVKPHIKALTDKLFQRVPAGVGATGFVKISKEEFKKVVEEGAEWAVKNGYGWEEDLERTELHGRADWADNSKISSKAIERGYNQIGTLGSGNHYLEIQWVKPENIVDEKLAKKWGIFPNQIVIMFHCGSRGFGHQIATDYLQVFLNVMERKYGIKILDRELACAPFNSPEGTNYYKAMACGVNMSFANRQVIVHRVREVFSEIFKQDAEKLGLHQVFDIAHNRASLEKHKVDGEVKELLVHRKGATAAYYPGREEIPKMYKDDGSPVIIGGSMETGSYLLVGTEGAKETFCSTAHGSGRTMSRTKAKKIWRGETLLKELEQKGIYVRSVSYAGAAEEAGGAYKSIDEVVEATALAGISKPVVRLIPIGNIKG